MKHINSSGLVNNIPSQSIVNNTELPKPIKHVDYTSPIPLSSESIDYIKKDAHLSKSTSAFRPADYWSEETAPIYRGVGIDYKNFEALNQTDWQTTANFTGRIVTGTVSKVVEGAGMILGSLVALIDRDMRGMTENPLTQIGTLMNEYANNLMPIKLTNEQQKEKGLFNKQALAGWADGISFLLSAIIPGGIITKAGLAAKSGIQANKLAAKVLLGEARGGLKELNAAMLAKDYVKAGEIATQLETKGLLGKYTLGTIENAKKLGNMLPVHAYNTISEAAFEGKDAYDTNIGDNVGKINPLTGQVYTEQELHEKANDVSAHVFMGNVALLSLTNIPETLAFGKVFGKAADRISMIDNNSILRNFAKKSHIINDVSSTSKWRHLSNFTRHGLITSFSEGLEELWQSKTQDSAKEGKSNVFIDGIDAFKTIGDVVKGNATQEESDSFYMGAILGLIPGGIGGVRGGIKDRKDYASDMEIKDRYSSLLNSYKGDFYRKNDDGTYELNKDGNKVLDYDKVKEFNSKLAFKGNSRILRDLAETFEDSDLLKFAHKLNVMEVLGDSIANDKISNEDLTKIVHNIVDSNNAIDNNGEIDEVSSKDMKDYLTHEVLKQRETFKMSMKQAELLASRPEIKNKGEFISDYVNSKISWTNMFEISKEITKKATEVLAQTQNSIGDTQGILSRVAKIKAMESMLTKVDKKGNKVVDTIDNDILDNFKSELESLKEAAKDSKVGNKYEGEDNEHFEKLLSLTEVIEQQNLSKLQYGKKIATLTLEDSYIDIWSKEQKVKAKDYDEATKQTFETAHPDFISKINKVVLDDNNEFDLTELKIEAIKHDSRYGSLIKEANGTTALELIKKKEKELKAASKEAKKQARPVEPSVKPTTTVDTSISPTGATQEESSIESNETIEPTPEIIESVETPIEPMTLNQIMDNLDSTIKNFIPTGISEFTMIELSKELKDIIGNPELYNIIYNFITKEIFNDISKLLLLHANTEGLTQDNIGTQLMLTINQYYFTDTDTLLKKAAKLNSIIEISGNSSLNENADTIIKIILSATSTIAMSKEAKRLIGIDVEAASNLKIALDSKIKDIVTFFKDNNTKELKPAIKELKDRVKVIRKYLNGKATIEDIEKLKLKEEDLRTLLHIVYFEEAKTFSKDDMQELYMQLSDLEQTMLSKLSSILNISLKGQIKSYLKNMMGNKDILALDAQLNFIENELIEEQPIEEKEIIPLSVAMDNTVRPYIDFDSITNELSETDEVRYKQLQSLTGSEVITFTTKDDAIELLADGKHLGWLNKDSYLETESKLMEIFYNTPLQTLISIIDTINHEKGLQHSTDTLDKILQTLGIKKEFVLELIKNTEYSKLKDEQGNTLLDENGEPKINARGILNHFVNILTIKNNLDLKAKISNQIVKYKNDLHTNTQIRNGNSDVKIDRITSGSLRKGFNTISIAEFAFKEVTKEDGTKEYEDDDTGSIIIPIPGNPRAFTFSNPISAQNHFNDRNITKDTVFYLPESSAPLDKSRVYYWTFDTLNKNVKMPGNSIGNMNQGFPIILNRKMFDNETIEELKLILNKILTNNNYDDKDLAFLTNYIHTANNFNYDSTKHILSFSKLGIDLTKETLDNEQEWNKIKDILLKQYVNINYSQLRSNQDYYKKAVTKLLTTTNEPVRDSKGNKIGMFHVHSVDNQGFDYTITLKATSNDNTSIKIEINIESIKLEILKNITYTNEEGVLCAEKGVTNSTIGSNWKIVKDFKGQAKHSEGGIDITISNGGVNIKSAGKNIKAKHGLLIPNIN